MRTASIYAHVKRIWNPEEDISLLGSFASSRPATTRIKPSGKKRKEEHLKYENP
jgi:hypothetical protein